MSEIDGTGSCCNKPAQTIFSKESDHFIWKIFNFSSLEHQKGDYVESETFESDNQAEWCMQIYPLGTFISDGDKYIALNLIQKSNPLCRRFSGSLAVRVSGYQLEKKNFDDAPQTRYHKNFLLRWPFFDCNELEIVCIIHSFQDKMETVSSTTNSITHVPLPEDGAQNIDYAQKYEKLLEEFRLLSATFESQQLFSKNFENLLPNQELVDIKIIVGLREFHAHKAVLAAQVPYFLYRFKDLINQDHNTISLDCDPDSFEDFLKIVYSGKEEYVTPTNAKGLYKTAQLCWLKNLQTVCCKHISDSLTLDNFLDTLMFAIDCEDKGLLTVTTEFFLRHMDEIVDTQQWQELLLEESKMGYILKEFLKYQDMNSDIH